MKTTIKFFTKFLFISLFATVAVGVFSNPTPIQAIGFDNPIIWQTDYIQFSASDFYIKVGDKYFFTSDQAKVYSDSDTKYSTLLEAHWDEGGQKMQMNLSFSINNNRQWKLSEVRTADGYEYGEWVNYYELSDNTTPVTGFIDAPTHFDSLIFKSNDDRQAEVGCIDCNIRVLSAPRIEYSAQGYGIEIMSGSLGGIVSLTTNPNVFGGVNAILRNRRGSVVTNQSDFTYEWSSLNENIATVSSDSIVISDSVTGCAFYMKPPCPPVNGAIYGISPGATKVRVAVKKSGEVVATSDINVIVRNESDVRPSDQPVGLTPSLPFATVKPSVPEETSYPEEEIIYQEAIPSTPTPSPENSEKNEQLRKELEEIRGTIGEIRVDVDNQREELSFLQKAVKDITSWFKRLFRIR